MFLQDTPRDFRGYVAFLEHAEWTRNKTDRSLGDGRYVKVADLRDRLQKDGTLRTGVIPGEDPDVYGGTAGRLAQPGPQYSANSPQEKDAQLAEVNPTNEVVLQEDGPFQHLPAIPGNGLIL